MRVLVACEKSGRVRDAFAARGHDAWSCDTEPSDTPGQHLQCDVLTVLDRGWDLMLAFPPCTYLCSSGLHWNGRTPGRKAKTEAALDFVRRLMAANIPKIGLENPAGRIGTAIRPADQTVHPWQFGDDASKTTCLWLRGLPPLVHDAPLFRETRHAAPRIVNGRKRWSNQTDSGQNREGPSHERAAIRATTYRGIAAAMAEQWGSTS